MASFDLWSESAPAVLAALWLLARPSSLPRLLLFAVIQISDLWVQLPIIPNHWLFCAFANGVLLAAYAALALARGSPRVDPADLYRAFAPPVRVGLLLMYGFAALHKLNADFFALDVSCAAEFYRAQVDALPFLPTGPAFEGLAIYGSLAAELAIPTLLFFRATRTAGIVLGSLFHGFLAFNPISGFYNYAAVLVPVYWLFAAPRALAGAGTLLRLLALRLRPGSVPGSRAGLAAGAALAGAALFAVGPLYEALGSRGLFLWLWAPCGMAALLFFAFALPWGARDPAAGGPPAGAFRIRPAGLALFPLLLVANGASPYLGLKTETSFAMFSNLRTEGDRTNHLFIPTGTQLFDYQRDLVRVVHTPDPGMARVARLDRLIPFLEFRSYMSQRPEVPIVYERGGRRVALGRAADDPDLARPPPDWLRKTLSFRSIDRVGRQQCVH